MALAAVLAVPATTLPANATDYMIMAPPRRAAVGTAPRAPCRKSCKSEGIAGNVQVQNVPGAGGTVGLAQFVSTAAGDASQLIVAAM